MVVLEGLCMCACTCKCVLHFCVVFVCMCICACVHCVCVGRWKSMCFCECACVYICVCAGGSIWNFVSVCQENGMLKWHLFRRLCLGIYFSWIRWSLPVITPTQKTEVGAWWVQGQLRLHSEILSEKLNPMYTYVFKGIFEYERKKNKYAPKNYHTWQMP